MATFIIWNLEFEAPAARRTDSGHPILLFSIKAGVGPLERLKFFGLLVQALAVADRSEISGHLVCDDL